jgi:hemoglobin
MARVAGEAARTLMPYQALGGSEAIRRIVERFYDLMDSEEQYAELRAMHAADLGPMRSSLAGWLIGWAGGPRNWFLENPGKCIMRAHRALGISPETAGQWSDAMARAIADCGPKDRELGKMVAEKLDLIARAMVVRDA